MVFWTQIPADVPGHYDAAGNVTRYDSKVSLWGLVGVSAGMYGLMSIINFFPKVWNLPGDAANRPHQFRLARTLVRLLKVFVMWLFTFILWNDVRVAQGYTASLPWWFLPLGLFAPLVMIVGWFYLAHRNGTA